MTISAWDIPAMWTASTSKPFIHVSATSSSKFLQMARDSWMMSLMKHSVRVLHYRSSSSRNVNILKRRSAHSTRNAQQNEKKNHNVTKQKKTHHNSHHQHSGLKP